MGSGRRGLAVVAMGNALMSRVLSRVRPAPAPEVESPVVSEPVRKLTFVKNPRLSFYSMDRKTTSKLDDRRYGEMSWFDFLVHTELCTMNYDALAKSDEDQLAHLVRMLENMKVPATLKKPVEDVIPFVCEVKAKTQGRKRVIQRGCSRSDSQEKSIHASSSSREMIARPKMSQIEWKTIEI